MFAQWRHLSSLSHYAFHSCHCSMIWIPAGGLGERSLLAGQVNSCWLQIKCFVSLVFSLSCFFGPFSKALGGRCKAVQGNYSLSGNFHLRNHAKTQFKFSLTFWLICQRIQLLLDRRVSSALLGLVGEGKAQHCCLPCELRSGPRFLLLPSSSCTSDNTNSAKPRRSNF